MSDNFLYPLLNTRAILCLISTATLSYYRSQFFQNEPLHYQLFLVSH